MGKDLRDQPEVQGDLFFTLAITYADISGDERGLEMFQHAADSYRIALGDENSSARALARLGSMQSMRGNPSQGKKTAQLAVDVARRCEDRAVLAECLYHRAIAGRIYSWSGRTGSEDLAKSVAAAKALGAVAVQVGTAYLLCPECTTSTVHRAALKSDAARHTAVTNVFTGRPARGIVNRLIRELGPVSEAAPAFPLAFTAVLPLAAKAAKEGRDDFSPMWAGQNVSGCKEVPAAELTAALAD